MADPAQDLGAVLFDRLAGAATIPALAAGEVDGKVVGRDRRGPPGRPRS